MKKILLTISIVFFSACSTSTMNGIMKSWEGKHVEQVISQWGYPNNYFNIGTDTIYVWNNSSSNSIPITSQHNFSGNIGITPIYGNYQTVEYQQVQFSCERKLICDKSGIVQKWEWNGNNCPFLEWFQYSEWRNKND